jgi:hypothetical protein
MPEAGKDVLKQERPRKHGQHFQFSPVLARLADQLPSG